MSVLDKLRATWTPERWRDVTVLVAVSGGADSVALLRALAASRAPGVGRLIVAHFNHRLRGEESAGDERFVQQLAETLDLSFVGGSAQRDLGDQAGGQGLEATARQARYDFLAAAAAAQGARYIATAHTEDDQVETVLHNVLRGTGLAGMAGIPRTRRLTETTTLIRPFLDATRAEVVSYLRELGQPYREDSTNSLVEFTRNRIRHELLPLLARDYHPGVRPSILKLAKIAAQTSDHLDTECQKLLPACVRPTTGGVEIDCHTLKHVHVAVVRQLLVTIWQQHHWPLHDMSLEKWELLVQLTQETQATTTHLPGAVLATRAGAFLRLTRSP